MTGFCVVQRGHGPLVSWGRGCASRHLLLVLSGHF